MRRGLILPLIAIATALAILLTLGTWQWQRLQWKQGLIAQIETRVRAEPVLVQEADRALSAGGDIRYMRVRAEGTFDHSRELHLYATGPSTWGWHVLTPLILVDGSALLVNRGFVPDALKAAQSRPASLVSGAQSVVGLVQVPLATRQSFVPDNEPDRNRWYWLDPAALLKSPIRPYVLEAERAAADTIPRGGVTQLDLANNHLGYALTWYGLAATLLVMTASWLWRRQSPTMAR